MESVSVVPDHVVSAMRQWLFQLLSSLLYKGCGGSKREFCNQVSLQLKNFTLAQVLHHIDLIRDRFSLDLRAELAPSSLSAERLLFEFYNALLTTAGSGDLLHGYVCNANQQSNMMVVRDALDNTKAVWARGPQPHISPLFSQDSAPVGGIRHAAQSSSAQRSASASRLGSASRSVRPVKSASLAGRPMQSAAQSVSGSRNVGQLARASLAPASRSQSRNSLLPAQSIQANTFAFRRQAGSVSVAAVPRKPSGASRTFASRSAHLDEVRGGISTEGGSGSGSSSDDSDSGDGAVVVGSGDVHGNNDGDGGDSSGSDDDGSVDGGVKFDADIATNATGRDDDGAGGTETSGSDSD